MSKILIGIICVAMLALSGYENTWISKNDDIEVAENVHKSMEAEDYLFNQIPELNKIETYISRQSDNQAHLIVESNAEIYDVNYNGSKQKCYMFYVGESWEDRRVNWYWFYVSEELDRVLWYDLANDKVLSLDQWRDSDRYKAQQVVFE